jgi:hypothetical protein
MTDNMLPIHLYALIYSSKIIVNWVVSIPPPCDLRYAFAASVSQPTLLNIINSPTTNKTSEMITNEDLITVNLHIGIWWIKGASIIER